MPNDKTVTTKIWLVMEFNVNNGSALPVAAYHNEQNARDCAASLVGRAGIYMSLQEMDVQDERI